jgi:hypothetical protein
MSLILSGTDGLSDVDGSASTPAIRGTDTNTGIFFPAADTIAFAEGGAEVARFDSSGNLFVGTTAGNSFANQTRLSINGTDFSGVSIFTGNVRRAQIVGSPTELTMGSSTAIPIVFNTSDTERMRITSGGSVVMGGTSAPTIGGVGAQNGAYAPVDSGAWALGLQQNTTSAGGGRVLSLRNVTDFNNSGNEVIYYTGNTTERFSVVSNGGIRNYSSNNVNLSDRREKTNIELAGSYLDKVCAIPVQTFNYIDQNLEEDAGLTLGVIAQDVQAVAPELVSESDWGTEEEPKIRLSIYQTDLQYALMKCIQEQQAIITDLKARLEILEAK